MRSSLRLAKRVAAGLGAGVVAGLLAACGTEQNAGSPGTHHEATHGVVRASVALPAMTDIQPRDYPGLHNAVAFHEGFVSGSAPQREAGFDTLAAMGVKTIISVDGAEPEVDRAAARGIRYIHLPIGYNGFDEERRLELVRATRDAMKEGPVYIHCHHGKHRSAGAAASVAASLGWLTPEEGVARMKVSGTAPNYTGLWACAERATVLEASLIDAAPADFPSVSRPTSFVQGMVEIDEAFEHLEAIEQAGWCTPADHPDLVPAAEAGRLADLYRALAAGEYARTKPAEFLDLIKRSRAEAQALEDLLLSADPARPALAQALRVVGASCKACHVAYRD